MTARTITRTAAAGTILGVGLALAAAVPASAHTPSGGASCDAGVWAAGHRYEDRDQNTLTVAVDGAAKAVDFATDGYLQLDIPADGRQHTWSWSVRTSNPDPAYDAADHGVITCGTVPPPAEHGHAWFRVVAYCNAAVVEGRHHVQHIAKRHPHRNMWVFRARSRDGYLFANGQHTATKRVHAKRGGACGGSSS